MIPSFARVSTFALCLAGALAAATTSSAQTNYYTTNGVEYAVVGSLIGEQMFSDVAVATNGGLMVWQDNATDGDGWGVSAQRLDGTLSGTGSSFRINVTGTDDQENPHVALLKNGGAVVVWQGGKRSYQHIYARFLTSSNTFLTTGDLLVSSANRYQSSPATTVLSNGNVVVVWSSFNQASTNSLQDVYAKILSPVGDVISNEFLVNQEINYNQRTPAVTALAGGGFVVAWVSEQQRVLLNSDSLNQTNGTLATQIYRPSVDIYARIYQADGKPVGNEFLANLGSNPCANPSVAAASDGSFMAAWSGRDMVTLTNGWDVYARPFTGAGDGGTVVRLNTYVIGAQYAPRLSAIGVDFLAVWTSLSQDGSREGVFGQYIHNDGTLVGGEFKVNRTVVNQQIQPAIASDGLSQFIAVWSSYTGGQYSFDLQAQRYVDVAGVLLPMSAPFVYAPFTLSNNIYQPQLQVSWPPLAGIAVAYYEVYVDGSTNPAGIVTSNQWVMTAGNGLTTNSTHSFQLDYVRTDGRRPLLSPATSGTTWSGLNWGGVPYEWMAAYYGGYINGRYYTSGWQSASAVLGTGGMTVYKVFLSGSNPLDSSTWLQQSLVQTSQGIFLNWNTEPGATYQVQWTTNFTAWNNWGAQRYAAGTNDSIYVGGSASGYYRVTLLR